jgi:hypothetical protein
MGQHHRDIADRMSALTEAAVDTSLFVLTHLTGRAEYLGVLPVICPPTGLLRPFELCPALERSHKVGGEEGGRRCRVH